MDRQCCFDVKGADIVCVYLAQAAQIDSCLRVRKGELEIKMISPPSLKALLRPKHRWTKHNWEGSRVLPKHSAALRY